MLGDDELGRGEATLKDMRTGSQAAVAIGNAAAELAARLGRDPAKGL